MMKRIWALVLSLCLVLTLAPFQASAADTVTVPVEARKLYSESFKMLEMVNAERASHGLSALTMDPELLELAMYRAFETSLYWEHTRPNGTHYSTLSSRLNRENISAKGGESIMPYDTRNVMDGLMNSSAHRANLLNSSARSIGIGVICIGFHVYWVQNFSFSAATGKASQPADETATMNVQVKNDAEHFKPKFEAESETLEVGEETQLYAIWDRDTPLPFERIKVHSSNPNVAAVNGSTVTAKAAGTTVLSIHYAGDHAGAQQVTIRVTGGEAAKPWKSVTFQDVDPDAFYAEPVAWAVNHEPQITNGTSAATFSPGATCTRGQVVTFLWRAMGCPEPESTENPFTDVKEDAFYYKAVLWAAENDVTTGTSETTFAPNEPCTRAHVVTFLWRAHEKPEAGQANPFTDVKDGQYYTDAVLWAVSKGITNGTSKTTFAPGDPCTRGQIVTFLSRDLL